MIGLGSKPLIIGERRANPLGALTTAQLAQANTWTALQTFSAGISFGQTTLSDYEKGTWTPVVTCATPGDLSVVNSNVVAKYTRVGNLVTVFLDFRFTPTFTTASGQLWISGLPFTPILGTNSGWAAAGSSSNIWSAGTQIVCANPLGPIALDTTNKLAFGMSNKGQYEGTFNITAITSGDLIICSLSITYQLA